MASISLSDTSPSDISTSSTSDTMEVQEKPPAKKKLSGVELLRRTAGRVIQEISMEKLKESDFSSQTDKLYKLTQHLMRERSIHLPKFGIFANLEQRLEPVVDQTGRPMKPADPQTIIQRSERRRRQSLNKHRKNSTVNSEDDLASDINSKALKARASDIVTAALWRKRRSTCENVTLNMKNSSDFVKRKTTDICAFKLNGLDRIAVLRRNVHSIENKFKTLVSTKKTAAAVMEARREEEVLPDICEYRPSRFKMRGMASALFRKYGKIIMIIHLWIRLLLKNDKCNWERELKSFVDISVGIEESQQPELMKKSGLSFDKSYFKTNKQISLSSEVRKTLTTRFSARTPEMLKQVLLGLQSLQSLGEYPIKTQERLCQVAWYQKVPAKKAIVRQGHPSECFYFVLGGTAIVKKVVEDPDTCEPISTTVAKLTKGQSFGEVGLIFDSKRTATVESATEMEMLVVGKSDFYQIFMNSDDPEEEPSHISYLRQQPLMKYWPIDVLTREPGACLLHYFKRGNLVSENGKESDWLYFIKSGTCEAIKSLRAVQPKPMKEFKSLCVVRELGIGPSNPRIDSGLRRKPKRHVINEEIYHAMTSYCEQMKEKEREISKKITTFLPDINTKPTMQVLITSAREEPGDQEEIIELPVSSQPIRCANSAGTARIKSTGNFSTTPAISFDKKHDRPKSTPAAQKPASVLHRILDKQVFVKVELLQAKDVFGLNTLKFVEPEESNIPSVALVSKGAEIVMLSKRLFVKHADDRVKSNVLKSVKFYPKEDILQENLQIKVDWENYRKGVIQDTLRMCKEIKSVSGI